MTEERAETARKIHDYSAQKGAERRAAAAKPEATDTGTPKPAGDETA